ncbi:hypothetical protein NCAS_0A01510 [Naumovozyma castellii]|uniref:Uncharacterized protein n=1 Tax=Naumovozyma castellii TaxID=27288 RepID=G0V5H3_NAUCA|nr:hypothetical protein NCAS_0A01510 [Naumovozyma castellii CBS 4309]CCC66709.1 hypothetical protein NCAS_0A01510 [Naumovozyma castellii CBS 4309]
MSVNEFANAQRSHYTIIPDVDLEDPIVVETHIPFVKLLDGSESDEAVEKRWELYQQLHSHFHQQVDGIIADVESDTKKGISEILFHDEETWSRNPSFNTLFLLGSDSSTDIELPSSSSSTMNALIDLTPKESPNVRMMLRRSMFKLLSQADSIVNNGTLRPKNEEINDTDVEVTDSKPPGDVSYDLSLVENFKNIFGRNLNMIINFKDVDSLNFQALDNFIVLLTSALKHSHTRISLVFNINTNLSNFEKNLRQSTIRLLKKNSHRLDVSSNKGFKYGNKIFKGFLDTVDGKLNLSDRFVKFLIQKMGNNANHNLQLLTKILDYALMSYFFENPFSVFIDPVNVVYLNEDYFNILKRCPTFMFFIEGLVKNQASSAEILGLLTNSDSALEEFFTEFLVRDNPINGRAEFVATFLEEELKIKNYNLIELYYNLLVGKLETYLDRWPQCQIYKEELMFEPIDTIFQELFKLDNNNGLLSQSLFPFYRTNLEDNMLSWERILPPPLEAETIKEEASDQWKLEQSMGPGIGQLFKLYREANAYINLYDFYCAFKSTLPREHLMGFTSELSKSEKKLQLFLQKYEDEKTESDDSVFDKIALILFMQAIFDLEHIGIISSQSSRMGEIVDKCIWRGI